MSENSILTVTRVFTHESTPYGGFRIVELGTRYRIDNQDCDYSAAYLWAQGEAVPPPPPVVESPPAEPEPGLHELPDLAQADIDALPNLWSIVRGFPVDAAAKIAQQRANTVQEPQYLINGTWDPEQKPTVYVVLPDPKSPVRAR